VLKLCLEDFHRVGSLIKAVTFEVKGKVFGFNVEQDGMIQVLHIAEGSEQQGWTPERYVVVDSFQAFVFYGSIT
jgi:hypothetical protein